MKERGEFVSDGPLQLAKRELQRILTSPRFWAAMAAVSLVLGLTGPFGTYEDLALLPRLAYWISICAGTFIVGMATILFVEALFRPDDGRGNRLGTLGDALAGLAASLPITLFVYGINSQVFSHSLSPLVLFCYCAAISVIVSVMLPLLLHRNTADDGAVSQGEAEAAGSSAVPEPPPILKRLPPDLRGPLTYMSMQDHYVEIHTERGSTLVLMRLADAIAEAGETWGLRIHRSHWITRDHVAAVERAPSGRVSLRMKDGALLPVSRSYLAAVREAGFG